MHTLQLAVLFKDSSFWCEGIPDHTTEEADLQAWKDDPEDRDCMISALTDLLRTEADDNASQGGKWHNESDEGTQRDQVTRKQICCGQYTHKYSTYRVAQQLRIAHLCVPETIVIHVSCLAPCRTWH